MSGLLPPSPAPPGSGCPQLHRPAATEPAAKVSHLHSNPSASRRTHDLRHSFAVRTLLGWYRAGLDVEALLPRLSTYLGHREPRFTYRYLTATPELLGYAAARLEAAQVGIRVTAVAPTLEALFTDRLGRQRQVSPRTIDCYRDTLRRPVGFMQVGTDKAPRAWAGTTSTSR